MQNSIVEVSFVELEEETEYVDIITKVVNEAFKTENILDSNLYLNVILTNPNNIRKINKKYRSIDKETDVLSFPMFEKEELDRIKSTNIIPEVLGDIIISIERVKEQAEEYGHSFERELAYMVIHGFYHVMGYDHMTDSEKEEMRKKEENVLKQLKYNRE